MKDEVVIEKGNIRIQVIRRDDIEAFGAYAAKSRLNKGVGDVLLNVDAMAIAAITEDVSYKEALIETLMHEFGHVLEEYYNLEFNEDRIEGIVESYREKYGEKA